MTSSQTSHSVIRVLYLLLFSSYSGLHHTPPNVKLGYIACFLWKHICFLLTIPIALCRWVARFLHFVILHFVTSAF